MVLTSNDKSTAELVDKPDTLRLESYRPCHEDRLKLLHEEIISQVTESPGFMLKVCWRLMDGQHKLLLRSGLMTVLGCAVRLE